MSFPVTVKTLFSSTRYFCFIVKRLILFHFSDTWLCLLEKNIYFEVKNRVGRGILISRVIVNNYMTNYWFAVLITTTTILVPCKGTHITNFRQFTCKNFLETGDRGRTRERRLSGRACFYFHLPLHSNTKCN